MTKPQFTTCTKGKYWRFRRNGIESALPEFPGHPDFEARYAELLELSKPREVIEQRIDSGSLAWLIERYQRSREFRRLAPATQKNYRYVLETIKAQMGHMPFRDITRLMVKGLRDKIDETRPGKAGQIQSLFSLLYTWAAQEELVDLNFNPTYKLKKLKGGEGSWQSWSEEEIALFFERCPKVLVTPILLALCTGQRVSDVAKMDWTDFQKGSQFIRVKQAKTGEALDIFCHRDLRDHLEAIRSPFGGPIVRNAFGKPMKPGAIAEALKRAIRKIDAMPNDRSIHGLRYAAAARLEEAGATMVEIVAVTGHRAYQMGMKYASQRKRAAAANRKLEAHQDGVSRIA